MTVPNDTILGTLIGELNNMGFASGTAAQSIPAISVAWELAEYGIGTNLLSSGTAAQQCEEHYFPTGWNDYSDAYRIIVLNKTRLTSIQTVTVRHENYDCNCSITEADSCAVIYNSPRSEISMGDCWTGACGCGDRSRAFRADICYSAGLYPTLADFDSSVIVALGLLYMWWQNLLATGGASASSGFIDSWRSMDYNESLKFIEKSVVGMSPQAAAAWQLLHRFRLKRAVVIRQHYPSEYRRGIY